MATSETTAYVFMGGMVCLGICALSGCAYFFRKRSEERARELAMEQELEDMIQRQRGIKHGMTKAQRMEDGLNGQAYNKQKQLQMLEEARNNLIQVHNAHLGNDGHGGQKSSLANRPKASQVQPALDVKDDDSDDGSSEIKKKKKKKRKSKMKKKKTKRNKRSKSRHSNSDTSDGELSSSGAINSLNGSGTIEESGSLSSSANTITESQKIGTGTSSKNDNNERDENKKKNKKSKESKTKRKTKKDNKIIPENFVKMQSHENKSDKDQAEKPSADKDQTVKPSVDKDQTEKPSAAKLRAELLPNLGLPEQKQSEINVIKTTNNIKANLPVEYWQPNNNQLHFYEDTFKVADEKGKGKIKGKQAVKFLNKSGLSKSMLRTIWALADYNKVGYLDQQGFLVACRYVAMVQYGVLKDDVEGATLTFEVFQRYMNDDKIPIPKFDE